MVASVNINITVSSAVASPSLAGAGISGGGIVSTIPPLSVGNVAVGDVVYAFLLGYATSQPSATITDNLGNTSAYVGGVLDPSGLDIYAYRIPITVAGAQVLTATFTAPQNYPYLYAAHMVPPAGLGFTGLDFEVSADAAGITLAGTSTAANDVLVSCALTTTSAAAPGSGQTMLYDGRASSGGCISWSQAGAAGAVHHTYAATGATVGVLVAEKMGVAPLSISVTPSNYTAPAGTVPAAGTVIAHLSAAGGDGNPVTFTEGTGGDPNLEIVSTGPNTANVESTGDAAVEGKTYTSAITGTQT